MVTRTSGIRRLDWGSGSSSKLTHMTAEGSPQFLTTWVSPQGCLSAHNMISDLSRESEWREGGRETHRERESCNTFYKIVSEVNHQLFHHILFEGNESLSSAHTQEVGIKLHLLKGVSKNFWPYFKTTIYRERERGRELSVGEGQVCLTSFIQSGSTIFSVSHLLLHVGRSCMQPSSGNRNFSINCTLPPKFWNSS